MNARPDPRLATDVAVNAIATFREAEKLHDESPTAALVLYTTSIELGLKVALLKPVVYGLVHNESVADLVSDLAVKHNGFDRFKPILASILAEYGEIDFNAFKIEGHKKTIWEEITHLQAARNAVVHRGEAASSENATLAKQVATMIFESFFVSVLFGLSLQYVKGGRITNAYPSLKLSTNGVSRWSLGAGPAAHFAPAAQRATPLAPA